MSFQNQSDWLEKAEAQIAFGDQCIGTAYDQLTSKHQLLAAELALLSIARDFRQLTEVVAAMYSELQQIRVNLDR
jgi:hypothetical protein